VKYYILDTRHVVERFKASLQQTCLPSFFLDQADLKEVLTQAFEVINNLRMLDSKDVFQLQRNRLKQIFDFNKTDLVFHELVIYLLRLMSKTFINCVNNFEDVLGTPYIFYNFKDYFFNNLIGSDIMVIHLPD
jgi:hypothetical protein